MTQPAETTALDALLDDPAVEALGMMLEAHNEVVNELQRRLGLVSSVPVPWIGVLIRLARSPDQRLRMTELARDMTMSTSGLTRLIDRVEKAGHVRRESCPEDRRGLLAVLTPSGAAILREILPGHVQDIHAVMGEALGKGELLALTDTLRTMRDHVREHTC